MENSIRKILEQSSELNRKIAENLTEKITEAVQCIVKAYKNDNKVLLFGNGGSAADAQHIAAELLGKFKLERDSLPAQALTTNTSTLSAVANDYDFEEIFERQIAALAEEGDVIIGISTSGESENVVKGILKAQKEGCTTIALTGRTGGDLKKVVDILINIPSEDVPRIQESHITVGHIVCELTERELFKKR